MSKLVDMDYLAIAHDGLQSAWVEDALERQAAWCQLRGVFRVLELMAQKTSEWDIPDEVLEAVS